MNSGGRVMQGEDQTGANACLLQEQEAKGPYV